MGFFSVLKNLLYVQSGGCTENKMLKKTDIGFEKISKPLVRCTLMNMYSATKHLVQGVYFYYYKYIGVSICKIHLFQLVQRDVHHCRSPFIAFN